LVLPVILDLYQGRKLNDYLEKMNEAETNNDNDGYVSEERVLLNILGN